MAQVEPMDVENDFEDKENSIQINNVLSRSSCTEKGYEELDVSELSMKLRYSITPCGSPMSKSYSGNCRDSKFCDIGEAVKNESVINGNTNLTQSLHLPFTNVDNKVSKIPPLQPLVTSALGDINRNPLSQRSLDSNSGDPNVTITLNDNDHLDSLSLPSTSSSIAHTPEATTPTKEIPKDGGSPIMRGLKSVFSMFRASQSPIPLPEPTIQPNVLIDSPSLEGQSKPATLASTPISGHKNKESSPKRNSPLKDSIAFKDDLEKELLWKNETTIIFKGEKIPISKLLLQQSQSNPSEIKQCDYAEKLTDLSVEYMDISHDESISCDKTMTDIEKKFVTNMNETVSNIESDGEFVDCETTFTKDFDITQNIEYKINKQEHSTIVIDQIKDSEVLKVQSANTNSILNSVNTLEITQTKPSIFEQFENNQQIIQIKNNEKSEDQIEKNEDMNKQISINQSIQDQLKHNEETGENKLVNDESSEVNAIEENINQETNCENNRDSTLSIGKINCEYVNNTSSCINSISQDRNNDIKESCAIEDCIFQNQSFTNTNDSMILPKDNNNTSGHLDPITKNENTDSLLNTNNFHATYSMDLSHSINNEIDKTIDLSINSNKHNMDLKMMDEKLNEAHTTDITINMEQDIKSLTSIDITENNVNIISHTSTLNLSSEKNIFQNDLTSFIETKIDNVINDVSLCDNNTKDIIKDTEIQINDTINMCDEEKTKLLNNDITDMSSCNKICSEDRSDMYNSNNNFTVPLPTDISLPCDSEQNEDKIIDKVIMIEKECIGNLKTNIYNELESSNLNKTVPVNINLTLPSQLDTISSDENDIDCQTINSKTEKLNEIDQGFVQNNLQLCNDLNVIAENEVSIRNDPQLISEKDSTTGSETGTVYDQNIESPLKYTVCDQDNNEYQIISSNIINEIDLKLDEDDEIITSAGNSPYVSVTEISLRENVDKEIDNQLTINKVALSPPISPKPIKKGYDINFDEIDDPFATKTKIRLSPTPETPAKKSITSESPLRKKNTDKKRDIFKSKQKLQNEKKSTKNYKNLSTKGEFILKNNEKEKLKSDHIMNIKTEFNHGENSQIHCGKESEESKVKLFNASFDHVPSDNEFKKITNNQTFEIYLSSEGISNIGTNIQHDKDTLNDVNIPDTDTNSNDNNDLNSATNEQNIFDVQLQNDDYKNDTVNGQDNKNITVDLLKDDKRQATNEESFNDTILKDKIINRKTFDCDLSINSNEDNITKGQEEKSYVIQEIDISKPLATSSENNTTYTSIEVEKGSIVTDLNIENNQTYDKMQDNLPVLDAENIHSMTELEVNHSISYVKHKSVLNNPENKFELFSENPLQLELKKELENNLLIDNNVEFVNKLASEETFITKANSLDHFDNSKEGNDSEFLDIKHSTLNFNAESSEEHHKSFKTFASENLANQGKNIDVEKISSSNVSVATCSSNTADDDNTVREIHTEDEDTVEGPFIEADEYSDHTNKKEIDNDKHNMMEFDFPPPLTTVDSVDNDELFIDAEAFEFLLNQNKSNVIADSGKESLFLKFDPLFAKRLSSDGILAAMSKIQKRQSTPNKIAKSSCPGNVQIEVSQPGTSKVDTIPNEFLEHIDVASGSKPMMVVNPAVNPIITPRKATPKLNRRSLTFTSPAIAVIDRLLSLNGKNPLIDEHTSTSQGGREYNETDIAITQLRELLAEKEIHVHNLRCESKELKDRLANLESQMKNLETESGDRLKKINTLNERLVEKSKINKSMALVVEEYERTIASLISDLEQDKKRNAEEKAKLVKERDEQTAHLASMEVSFSDLHSKYEKSKQIILSMKANEDKYKNSVKEFEDSLVKMQSNYEFLKQHATSKLNHANQELEKINKAHESEVLKLNAMIKRKELHITSLEETLMQKTKANEELTAICDELINKVG